MRTLLVLLLFIPLGCQNRTNPNPKDEPSSDGGSPKTEVRDGLSAREISDKMQQNYRETTAYHDQGTLHISYKLQGRFMEEPHLWSVDFQRDGKLKSSVYQVRLLSDGQRLSCFIYDFRSANLDNQRLIRAFRGALPLRTLFQDGISRHYLTGQNELPLHKNSSRENTTLFPPALGLLTDTVSIPWLNSDQIERREDASLFGRMCWQLCYTDDELRYLVWIDQQDHLIRQIKYPIELLDARLQDNPSVTNIELVARFPQASTQPNPDASRFQHVFPQSAKLVSAFVAVPEPFPSTAIGQPIPELGLRHSNGSAVQQSIWKGKVALLAWLPASSYGEQLSAKLAQLATQISNQDYHVAEISVPSDDLPLTMGSRGTTGGGEHAFYQDTGFEGGKAIGVKHYPTLAIIDRNGQLQYVRSLSDASFEQNELAELLLRVRSGDNVAAEMRLEYERFLEAYHERLATVSLDSQSTNGQDLVTPGQPQYLSATKVWENTLLRQPGNLLATPDRQLLAVDGWRTLAQLDDTGKLVRSSEMELPSRQTISRLRLSTPPSATVNTSALLAFSTMGKQIHLIPSLLPQSQLAAETAYSVRQEDMDRIADVLTYEASPGVNRALVTHHGHGQTVSVNLATGQVAPLCDATFQSMALLDLPNASPALIGCNGKATLLKMDLAGNQQQTIATELRAITRVHIEQAVGAPPAICLIGTDQQGRWVAMGCDQSFNKKWLTSLGNQSFDTQIEPVTYAKTASASSGIWAIATQDGRIQLVGDDGLLIDQWNYGKPIYGLAMIPQGDRYLLAISTENCVEGWQLQAIEPRRPAP